MPNGSMSGHVPSLLRQPFVEKEQGFRGSAPPGRGRLLVKVPERRGH